MHRGLATCVALALAAAALLAGAAAGAAARAAVPARMVHRAAGAQAACMPADLGDGEPRAVAILADGISSRVEAGSYTPANPSGSGWSGHQGGYCVAYRPGQADPRALVEAAGLPAPRASLCADYAFGLSSLATGCAPTSRSS